MKIIPAKSDFRNWIACVPSDGDLVFLSRKDAKLFSELPVPILTTDEARAGSLTLWTLNFRSWYGYVLNKAAYCAWLPTGTIESLDPSVQSRLAEIQIKLGVPTIIGSSRLPKDIRRKSLEIHQGAWITSAVWSGLSITERIRIMEAWFKQNEIQTYQSLSLQNLSSPVQKELKRLGYDKLLNRYRASSGPNCFAAAAGAIAPKKQQEVARQWLHWKPFARFMKDSGYEKKRTNTPLKGDVLVFSRKGDAVHAAYILGDGLYFEKPGQDFYEPYRVVHFKKWKTEWPRANLSIWRRDSE